ncbi:hypothetical protein Droror1_Dr00016256 [Drosera rotundifolia]
MSDFCGCGVNLVTMVFATHVILLFLYMAALVIVDAGGDMFELYSREEMVELAGYGEDKLSTVVITGTIHCHANSSSSLSLPLHHPSSVPLSGALVATTCKGAGNMKKKRARVLAVTNEYGEFVLELPSHIHGILNLEKGCSVTIQWVPENSPCQSANFHRNNIALKISSVGNGIRTYTIGEVTLKRKND